MPSDKDLPGQQMPCIARLSNANLQAREDREIDLVLNVVHNGLLGLSVNLTLALPVRRIDGMGTQLKGMMNRQSFVVESP